MPLRSWVTRFSREGEVASRAPVRSRHRRPRVPGQPASGDTAESTTTFKRHAAIAVIRWSAWAVPRWHYYAAA
jgi:hypothetical protein